MAALPAATASVQAPRRSGDAARRDQSLNVRRRHAQRRFNSILREPPAEGLGALAAAA
jgi:hypothetical protein